MKPVGYLVNHPDGLYGERGLYYDYILSGNGVWIEAEGPFLGARVPVAYADIRGLAPLEPQAVLRYGKIPGSLFDLADGHTSTRVRLEIICRHPHLDGYVC